MSDDAGLVVPDYEPSSAPATAGQPQQNGDAMKPKVRVGGMAPRIAIGIVGVLLLFVLIASLAGEEEPEPVYQHSAGMATVPAPPGSTSAPNPPSRQTGGGSCGESVSYTSWLHHSLISGGDHSDRLLVFAVAVNPCDSNPCVHGTW